MSTSAVARATPWAAVLLCSLDASAQPPVVTRTTPKPNEIVYRIDRPDVKRPLTAYAAVTFEPGDRLVVDAGGCVQTGGRGRTWKHYVHPQGAQSELYYSGTLQLPGVVPHPLRIAGLVGQPLDIPSNARRQDLQLRLGYQDARYADNGYHGHDDGTQNQCRGVGPAWVRVSVQRARPPRPVTSPRYDEIYQRSAHNSFAHTGAVFAGKTLTAAWPIHRLMATLGFRSIELDVRYDGCHWKVYHHWIDKAQTTCKTLGGCLDEVRRFQRTLPAHEIVTAFLDMKDAFEPGGACPGPKGELWSRSPGGFDAFLAARVGANKLFTPRALLRSCPSARTLQEVPRLCGWPRLDVLRGRVMFVLEGQIPTYAPRDGDGLARTAFLMQGVDSRKAFYDGLRARQDVVFFNFDDRGHWPLLREIYRQRFITRVWVMNNAAYFQRARNAFVHHIATDEIRAPFTRTQDHARWPFSCRTFDCGALREGSSPASTPAPTARPPARQKGISAPRTRAPPAP